MQITLTRRTSVLALATAGVLATVGVGWASIPGPNGEIKACYSTKSGVLGLAPAKGTARVGLSLQREAADLKPAGPAGRPRSAGPRRPARRRRRRVPADQSRGVGPPGKSGIVDIKTSSGATSQPPGDEGYPTTFAFARPPHVVDVQAGQAVLGIASMSIRTAINNRQLGLRYAICSRPADGGALRLWGDLFGWYGTPNQSNAVTTHALLALAPGRYEIGSCVAAQEPGLFDFNNSSSSTSLLVVNAA